MKTAIIGGGAAGFFLAINLKEMCPDMSVTIFEASSHVLSKVKISGGGRCNCTNSFASVRDLQNVYPRGHQLMKRLFKTFDYHDAYNWFERRGVPLIIQDDECVFPLSQDSHSIIDLFLREANRLSVEVITNYRIQSLNELADYDYIAVTVGGQPRTDGLQWLGQTTEPPVPSLFSFSIDDKKLQDLKGAVIQKASAMIPGTKLRAEGPLLITHWGMSGPCILRLSSYAARMLHNSRYHLPLSINWTGKNNAEVQKSLMDVIENQPRKHLASIHLFDLQQRLWNYLIEKTLTDRIHIPCGSLNKKEVNRLVNILTNDTYQICARSPFKDEFVTCGGISLRAVNPSTLESKTHPRLYFAGEVLDIDGVTGGFNFQAAWTTAYTVATAISASSI